MTAGPAQRCYKLHFTVAQTVHMKFGMGDSRGEENINAYACHSGYSCSNACNCLLCESFHVRWSSGHHGLKYADYLNIAFERAH